MKHPSSGELGRLASLAFDREKLGALAWHLYRCPTCRARVAEGSASGRELLDVLFRDLDPREDEVAARPSYASAFDAARRRAVAGSAVAESERRAAGEVIGELAALAPGPRTEKVMRDPRLHSWAMAEELLEVYRKHMHDDPHEAERWVRLALDVAGAVRRRRDRFRPSDPLVSDLEARILAALTHCLRNRSRLREADRTIADAETRLERGTGDPLERAVVLDSKASLRRAQRRFPEALDLTRRAVRLYRQLVDPARLVAALINRATLESYLDRRLCAIDTLQEALGSIDPVAEPKLWMSASYNLAATLHEMGRTVEAAEKLAEVRPLVESSGGAIERAKFRWFEGMVARDGGDPAHAERLFGGAHDEFLRLGMAYEVALVSLDLAALYLDQGRTAETRRLAESMLPIFRSRDIHREATAALLLFHRAAVAETATAALAADVAAKVRRGRAQGTKRSDERPS